MSLLRALWVGLLLLNTWKDLRHREIYPGFTLGAGILAGILRIREGASLWELGAGLLPGVFFLGAAWISRGQVGAGDGLMLCAGGFCLGLVEILMAVSLGLLLGILAGAVRRIRGKEKEFPFLPCLLAGWVIERIWWN